MTDAVVRDRPDLPKGYISRAPKGHLWIVTTDPDGRPHLVQQWGAWSTFEGAS